MINNYPYGVNDGTGKLSGATGIIIYDANGRVKFQSTGGGGSAAWGSIGTGTGVGSQTDLVTYLNANYYPLASNPAGYITSAALAPYLTSASAAATYYPLTNPAGYITSAALSPYLTAALAAATYVPLTRNITINGVTQDLSADRTWTVTASAGDITVVTATTTNQREDNWAPTGWTGAGVKIIEFAPTYSNNVVCLGGLTNGAAGRMVTIVNTSTDQLIIFEHESTSSTSTNRFKMQQQCAFFLLPGRDITFLYNGTRWSQFNSANNFGGFDFVDDFTQSSQNGSVGTVTGQVSTALFNTISSGTGASIQSDAEYREFGRVRLRTGTTTTGQIRVAIDIRNSSGGFWSSAIADSFPIVTVSKVKLDALPDLTNDFRCYIGHNLGVVAQITSAVYPGYFWYVPDATSGLTTWQNVSTNSTGGTTLTTNTGIPLSTGWIYLGLFTIGNRGDLTYFYSTDGVTYQVASKYTWTTAAFGGRPYFGINKTLGTTDRIMYLDWFGIGFNLKR